MVGPIHVSTSVIYKFLSIFVFNCLYRFVVQVYVANLAPNIVYKLVNIDIQAYNSSLPSYGQLIYLICVFFLNN